MKVSNMINSKGNKIANQFVITDTDNTGITKETFQSYNSVIVTRMYNNIPSHTLKQKTYLDINKWDYSVTTGTYRNQFLNETKKETQAKIDSGEYILTDLNG